VLLAALALIGCPGATPPPRPGPIPESEAGAALRRERIYLIDPFEGFSGTTDAARRESIERAHEDVVAVGSIDAAGRAAADILALTPSFSPAQVLAAQVDFVRGQDRAVVERLLPVGDQQPNYTASQLLLARAAERQGDVPLAYAAFRAIATRSSLAFSRTGELHSKALTVVGDRLREAVDGKHPDDAQRQLDLLISWAPNEDVTYEGAREIAVSKNDKRAELVAVRGLLAKHPADVPLLERRADLELDEGDSGTGLKIIQDLADKHPRDAALASRLASAKFRWSLSLLPKEVRQLVPKAELTKADYAVLLYWLCPQIRYSRPGTGRIATDLLDQPRHEEMVRIVNLGLMEVDSTLHHFGPTQPMRRGAAVRVLDRLLTNFAAQTRCVKDAVAQQAACGAAVGCGVSDEGEACDAPDTLTGEEAIDLIRRALEVLGPS
jgi:hypothetical protein